MSHYIRSEFRRLRKKKINYIVTILGVSLLIGVAYALNYINSQEPSFPYGTSLFYYANILLPNFLLLLTGTLAVALLGRDRDIISTSISFGVKRSHIYWGKYLVTLINALIICALFIAAAYGSGEYIIVNNSVEALHLFIKSIINLLPILISAFTIVYTVSIVTHSEFFAFSLVFLLYRVVDYVSPLILKFLPESKPIMEHLPARHLSDLAKNMLQGSVDLDPINWGINIGITIIVLLIGALIYRRKNY